MTRASQTKVLSQTLAAASMQVQEEWKDLFKKRAVVSDKNIFKKYLNL